MTVATHQLEAARSAVEAHAAIERALLGGQRRLYSSLLPWGQSFKPPTEPMPVDQLMTPRECFRNCGSTAISDHRLSYVEGFALSQNIIGLPIHHAWLVDQDGLVIEPTWDEPGYSYFGLLFSYDAHRAAIERSKFWDVLPVVFCLDGWI